MADAKFNVAITADDKSAKGVASAGKRFSKLAKEAGAVGRDAGGLRRFSEHVAAMERATSRSFGRKSITSSIGERFSAVSQVGRVMGAAGGAEAAEAGGVLSGLAGAAGVAAGALIAVGAAAVAAVDDWSKNAAQLGRLAAATGVASKTIDAMVAAAETQGVSRQQTEGNVASLSKLLNDARYGRSNETLALNNQLGLAVKTQANGAPDVADFMGKLADAIARQTNPETQREIASRYGVEAQLPLLQLGGDGYRKEVARGAAEGISRDKSDTDAGRKEQYETTRVKQEAARTLAAPSALAAPGAAAAAQHVADAGRAALDSTPKGVAAEVSHVVTAAAGAVGHALDAGAHVVERGFGRVCKSLEDVVGVITQVAKKAGLDARQMLTTARIESHFDPRAHAKTSSAAGLYQFLKRSGAELGVAGDDRYDPRKAAEGYAREMKRDLPRLEKRLGRSASPWEMYLLHQRGLGGAEKLLAGDQDRNAVAALGRKEVLNNGGNVHMTVGEFRKYWQRQYAAADRANASEGVYRKAEAGEGGATPSMPGAGPVTAAELGLAKPPPAAPPAAEPPVAKAEVTIKLSGAPDGTVSRVTSRPGVDVRVERAALGG